MRLRTLASTSLALAVCSGVALTAAFTGCASISGINDLQVTEQDCVKNCPDTGGSDATSETPPAIGTLKLEPGDQVVFIDTTTKTPATLTYKATLTASDGTSRDVTSTTTFTLENSALGTFTGAAFKSVSTLPEVVATTTVRASAEGATATARLSVVALKKDVDLFVTPVKDTPQKSVLLSRNHVDRIDLVIMMDTTGSMSGAIKNVQDSLKDTLFSRIADISPDAAIAIADHKDYPINPFGDPTDFPVKILQTMTKDATEASAAANMWAATGGYDTPEAQIPAMHHALTGNALNWTGGTVPAHTPAEGTTGGVDFRPNALKVITLITDADWHGEGHTPYTGFTAPTMAALKSEFVSRGAKFIDLTTPFGPEDQANELSDATLSSVPLAAFGSECSGQCCTGLNAAARPPVGGNCRLNFLHNNGAFVSEALVNAIRALPKGLSFAGGIGAKITNEGTNPDGVDVSTMITVRAMNEGTTECISRSARDTNMDSVLDTFNGPASVENKLCFELTINSTIAPKPTPQFYIGYVDFLGEPGEARLERRTIVLYVPPS